MRQANPALAARTIQSDARLRALPAAGPEVGMVAASLDSIARPFVHQVAQVRDLVAANRARMAAHQTLWDDWFDRIAKLPVAAQAYFPEAAAAVAAIEAASAEIVRARDLICLHRDAAMFDAIRHLAASSATTADLGQRIATDFAIFRAWRAAALDGVDCDMFALLEWRTPSARPPRGEAKPLFDRLFLAWAKAAGLALETAEQAARVHLAAMSIPCA